MRLTGTAVPACSGDHTVKILSASSGRTLQVMHGHMRTPWVVRWHPTSERILASGSLDHHVRLWDADTGDCIAHHDFGALQHGGPRGRCSHSFGLRPLPEAQNPRVLVAPGRNTFNSLPNLWSGRGSSPRLVLLFGV